MATPRQLEAVQRLQEAVLLSSWQLSPSTSVSSSAASSNRSSTCSVHEASLHFSSCPPPAYSRLQQHESLPSKIERTLNRRGSIRRKVKHVRSRSEHRSRSARAASQQIDDGATPRFLRIEQLLDVPAKQEASASTYTLLDQSGMAGGSSC